MKRILGIFILSFLILDFVSLKTVDAFPRNRPVDKASPDRENRPMRKGAPREKLFNKTIGLSPSNKNVNEPQIGLNFIRFYWVESRDNSLNKTTPYLQPDYIFKDFANLGVQGYRQFIKADLLWDIIEAQDNQWNFEAADAVIENPTCQPIVTLFSNQYASPTPPWAGTPAEFKKQMGAEAIDYVETVVKRYAQYVKYWEIGNEMDHWRAAGPGDKGRGTERLPPSCPQDGFSPVEQGKFLAEAAQIIRKNDPDAVILMPGISGLSDYCINTWLSGVIQGGGKDWFDIVNYHYYSNWERYGGPRQKFQKTLESLGISNKPIWMTETGATSSPELTIRTNYPNSPESQAADIFRRIIQGYGFGDSYISWHTYISSSGSESKWQAYGILTEKGEKKPAYYAFKLLISELIPMQTIETISSDSRGVNIYKITTKSGTAKYVVWGAGTFTIPAGMMLMTSVVPDANNSYTWQSAKEGASITLSEIPVLLK